MWKLHQSRWWFHRLHRLLDLRQQLCTINSSHVPANHHRRWYLSYHHQTSELITDEDRQPVMQEILSNQGAFRTCLILLKWTQVRAVCLSWSESCQSNPNVDQKPTFQSKPGAVCESKKEPTRILSQQTWFINLVNTYACQCYFPWLKLLKLQDCMMLRVLCQFIKSVWHWSHSNKSGSVQDTFSFSLYLLVFIHKMQSTCSLIISALLLIR